MSTRDPVTPRAWLGASPMPWPSIDTLQEGETVLGCYCVVNVQVARTRQDKLYLKVVLTDRNGAIEARVWDEAEAHQLHLKPGAYVGIRGRLEVFNTERQVRVEDVTPLHVELDELDLFLPRSRRTTFDMDRELEELVRSLRDPALRALTSRIFSRKSETGAQFRLSPAAKFNHHAVIGGLQEHTLSVARVCDAMAAHYGDQIDRDLLVAGALLHDIGKVREISSHAGFPYTDEGKLLGHILLGLRIVQDAAQHIPDFAPERRMLLEHLIAAHQGRYEWQSPREPAVLEALVLHYVDDLDAKFNQASALLPEATGWSEYDRGFRRAFLKHLTPSAEHPEPNPDGPLGKLSTHTLDLFNPQNSE